MEFKNWFLKEEVSLRIKKQSHNYDCGPAALHSILSHFNIKVDYDKLVKQCKTTKNCGTNPENIIKIAKLYGLKAHEYKNMTIKQLKKFTKQQKPIIASIQSWGNEKNKQNINSGHYVIVTKVDEKFVHFKDPYYQSKDHRKMTINDFFEIWIDKDENKILNQFGIVFERS